MLLTKKIECPTCGKKVKKSDLMLVETTIKTRVTCCPSCIKYLNVKRKIKDDKALLTKKQENEYIEDKDTEESIYKKHLKAKNIDILKQTKKEKEDILPDEKEIEKRALEEQKNTKNKEKEKIEKKEEIDEITKTKKEETKKEIEDKTEEKPEEKNRGITDKEEKQSTSLLETIGIKQSEQKTETIDESITEKIETKRDNYFGDSSKKEETSKGKITEKEEKPDLNEKKIEEKQIIGSNTNADAISSTIQKKQKERGFEVTAADWMVTSDPMIDKISLAIERKQKERAEKGYIKIKGSKVERKKRAEDSEQTVIPIEEDAEKEKKDKTIEEKVDEKVGEPEKKPYEAPGTKVKKILKVRCPSCSQEFSIEKKSGKVHLKCPNCGEEGTVEL